MSDTEPTKEPNKDRVREELHRAVRNSVGHCKRSLLDFLEFQKGQHPEHAAVLGYVMRRVHNDVSLIADQVLACFQIYENNGVIPPMGRTDEARTEQPVRDRKSV
jgi:hypothetical protein